MTNEFHTIQAPCVNLIPIGPGYENVSLDNQVCTTVGSVSGQVNVDGNRFLELMYDYSHDSLWTVSCHLSKAYIFIRPYAISPPRM